MAYREVVDTAVAKERFRIDDCIDIKDHLGEADLALLKSVEARLNRKQFKAFLRGIIRNSFLIELVNEEVTSTKFRARWSVQLQGDVRYASYEECFRIFQKILSRVAALSQEDLAVVLEFLNNSRIPYEMPIDYIDRYAEPIHTAENMDLVLDETVRKCVQMRRFVGNATKNPAAEVFSVILADKIKVKTYLTDRAQTGEYKTNREKRWEAHPNSVQYALRRDCMAIETKLLRQVAMFEGCDQALVANMQRESLLPVEFSFCRCPITGENIQYREFAQEILHPTHGRSAFQVGHLNPLKSQDTAGAFGHTADNISWISENGNRIQGSLSMEEVDTLLKQIYQNRPELRER